MGAGVWIEESGAKGRITQLLTVQSPTMKCQNPLIAH